MIVMVLLLMVSGGRDFTVGQFGSPVDAPQQRKMALVHCQISADALTELHVKAGDDARYMCKAVR